MLARPAPAGRLFRITRTAVTILLLAFGFSILYEAAIRTARTPLSERSVWSAFVSVVGDRVDVLRGRGGARTEEFLTQRRLGFEQLQRARDTADPTHYGRAEAALQRAWALNPADPDTAVGLGTLALARHRFEEALTWGERARELNPNRAAVYGVIGDAQIELGRYDEAFDTFQVMVNLRPDLASYARASYALQLQGDLEGATAAMRLAASSGLAAGEPGAWTRVQLGHLLLLDGQIVEAEREFRWALAAHPANMAAVAGLGRARLTAGDLAGAIPFYEQAVERYPLPELVVTLGELYEAVGRGEDAARQFALVGALQQLVVANGGNADLELALFEAERGDPARALELARAEVARRPSIHAYDALAWALYQVGDYPAAADAASQALRLGTDDALMLFHAAMIDLELGDRSSARERLARALARDPAFSVRHAATARRLLAELGP